jgi:hypothetical protein
MKNVLMICAVAASIVLCGCAANNKAGFAIATVGPAPMESPVTGSGDGTLMVYSAFRRNADFNTSDPNRPEHSDCKILNADGSVLRRVHNIGKTVFEGAVPVSLPPGKYEVVARANEYGYLTIPVRIEPQQTTSIHLEGGGFWSDESQFNDANSVRLPNGEIIGWKSTTD